MTSLTVGLVGAGGISHAHAPSWLALDAQVLVHSERGAPALAHTYGLEVVTTLDELLERVDLVDVCTPTPTHAAVVDAALDAGRDVVCEKPLARTATDAAALAAKAARLGLRLLPGHVVRYFPEYAALHAAVAAGRIGTPAVLRFTRGGMAPTGEWFHDDAQSGGIVLDQMVHDFDQARWIAGDVARVYAVLNRIGSIAVAHATLTHTTGAVSFIQGTWGATGVAFATSFDVAGSAGRLRFDSRALAELDENLGSGGAVGSYLPTLGAANPYVAELTDFASAIRHKTPARVSAEDGVAAIAIAEAALASIATGASVVVEGTR